MRLVLHWVVLWFGSVRFLKGWEHLVDAPARTLAASGGRKGFVLAAAAVGSTKELSREFGTSCQNEWVGWTGAVAAVTCAILTTELALTVIGL